MTLPSAPRNLRQAFAAVIVLGGVFAVAPREGVFAVAPREAAEEVELRSVVCAPEVGLLVRNPA